MKKSALFFAILFSLYSCQSPSVSAYQVDGIENSMLSLDGTWEFTMDEPGERPYDNLNALDWQEVQVPGELAMQGFPIKHDRPYLYRTTFEVPADFDGHRPFLRFDGVYSEARVFVNGQEAGSHLGGFTRWELDISDLTEPGSENQLIVEVTDRQDDISYGSGYAKHQIGGILRSVTLVAKPPSHLTRFYINTDLDDNYEDALLQIQALADLSGGPLNVELYLEDPAGEEVSLENNTIRIETTEEQIIRNPVSRPLKWDAEHPHLYTLRVTVTGESGSYSFIEKVGFREIVVEGDQLLVNGMPVKLRGANRHDIHPTLGRMSTPELDKQDVLLAKEANMNYLRTSHYPPSESFLDYCDQYGIYVEDETAVCFVNTHRSENYMPSAYESDPAYTDWFLGQLKEMVHWHRNHPSVIIWSIGNENAYGSNFQASYDYVKAADPSRPVKFSYPGKVPDSVTAYDVLSMHYVNVDGSLNQYGIGVENFSVPGIPTVHDEYAHVACYNVEALRNDPNVRDFWGESMDKMWSGVFDNPGALGGAIWGMIDETFMVPLPNEGFKEWWGIHNYDFPTHTVGYGEWGIIDTWRRKKPEFWHTKKAYSPARVMTKSIDEIMDGVVEIPVYNRFDHTNFNELTVRWETNGKEGLAEEIDLAPHEKGTLSLDIGDPAGAEFLTLSFYKKDRLIDTFRLSLPGGNSSSGREQETTADASLDFQVEETNGLLTNAGFQENNMIISGPHLVLKTQSDSSISFTVHQMRDWAEKYQLTEVSSQGDERGMTLLQRGKIEQAEVRLETTVEANTLDIRLTMDGSLTDEFVKEAGIEFVIADAFDSLYWERNGYWSTYPEGHLGALSGSASLTPVNPNPYRERPERSWHLDPTSFFYHGMVDAPRMSFLATGYKEDVEAFTLTGESGRLQVAGVEENTVHARIFRENGQLRLRLVSLLDYPNLEWGNYMRNIELPDRFQGHFNLVLSKR